jgi:hypothetical protein
VSSSTSSNFDTPESTNSFWKPQFVPSCISVEILQDKWHTINTINKNVMAVNYNSEHITGNQQYRYHTVQRTEKANLFPIWCPNLHKYLPIRSDVSHSCYTSNIWSLMIHHFITVSTRTLTHCGPVTQICVFCVFALQLWKTDDANLPLTRAWFLRT